MPEKPRIILVLAVLYLISPLTILVQTAMNVDLPVFGPLNIWSKLQVLDFCVLAAYLVAAVAIWSIKKPAWYLFMALSAFLIVANIVVAVRRPSYQPLLILAYNLVLTLVASVFFRKSIIAPFFHPRLRWWENLPRYNVRVRLVIETGAEAQPPVLRDISRSGCFVTTTLDLKLHHEYDARLIWFGQDLALKARIVRIGSFAGQEGYGISFVHVSPASAKKLENIVQHLDQMMNESTPVVISNGHVVRPVRIRLSDRAWITHAGHRTAIDLIDISASGCSFETSIPLDRASSFVLEWELRLSVLNTPGRIVWEDKRPGHHLYGLVFQSDSALTSRTLHLLVRQFKTKGARPRVPQPAHPDIIAAAAEQTPYRFIKRISSLNADSRN